MQPDDLPSAEQPNETPEVIPDHSEPILEMSLPEASVVEPITAEQTPETSPVEAAVAEEPILAASALEAPMPEAFEEALASEASILEETVVEESRLEASAPAGAVTEALPPEISATVEVMPEELLPEVAATEAAMLEASISAAFFSEESCCEEPEPGESIIEESPIGESTLEKSISEESPLGETTLEKSISEESPLEEPISEEFVTAASNAFQEDHQFQEDQLPYNEAPMEPPPKERATGDWAVDPREAGRNPYRPRELSLADQVLLVMANVATYGGKYWKRILRWVRSQLPPTYQAKLSDGVLSAILLGCLVLLLVLWNPLGDRSTAPQLANPSVVEPAPIALPEETPGFPEPMQITPEQTLISDIQEQVATITNAYAAGLIQSVQVDFRQGALRVNVGSDWYGLMRSQQDQIAQDIYQRSQELSFTHLYLLDDAGQIIARNPVVGDRAIILLR